VIVEYLWDAFKWLFGWAAAELELPFEPQGQQSKWMMASWELTLGDATTVQTITTEAQSAEFEAVVRLAQKKAAAEDLELTVRRA
jgi:hypothetical protein